MVSGFILFLLATYCSSSQELPGVSSSVVSYLTFYSLPSWFLVFQVFVAPPMYRTLLRWYHNHLPEIAYDFSKIFSRDKPLNMFILSSFINQGLLDDGANLNPVSGLHYLLHLFDESERLLNLASQSSEVQHFDVAETARANRDRITLLEHDHVRLSRQIDLKVAYDSEFNDWVTNRSEEDWVNITGLPRLSSSATMSKREWQQAVKRQVRGCLLEVVKHFKINIRFEVLWVVNPIKGRTTGLTVLDARLSSVEASKAIRDAFSGFFRNPSQNIRPPGLKGVSVRNKTTFETRIRVQILKELGKNYQAKNPDSSFSVRGFDSRPAIILVPPSGASDPRIKNMGFVDTVRQPPEQLSQDNLFQIFKVIGRGLIGKLRSLFVILSDDEREQMAALVQDRLSSRFFSITSTRTT